VFASTMKFENLRQRGPFPDSGLSLPRLGPTTSSAPLRRLGISPYLRKAAFARASLGLDTLSWRSMALRFVRLMFEAVIFLQFFVADRVCHYAFHFGG